MSAKKKMNRRFFLKTTAASAAGAGFFHPAKKGFSEEQESPAGIRIKEYRTLGRTGFKASDIGAGKPFTAAVLRVLLDTCCRLVPSVCPFTGCC